MNQREEAYRIYISDAFKAIGSLDRRYVDVIKPQKIEARTSEEVIDHIRSKLNESV